MVRATQKVTDFGLSQGGVMDNVSAKTMCGTLEDLAPVILEVGALVYEMLTGLPPYYTRDRDRLLDRNGDLSCAASCLERSRVPQ